MKDVILSSNDDTKLCTLRCDMFQDDPANITVVEIKNAQGKIIDSYVGAVLVQRKPYSWQDFKVLCDSKDLSIDITETNGSGKTRVLDNKVEEEE